MPANSFYLYSAVNFDGPDYAPAVTKFVVRISSSVPPLAYKLMKLCHVCRYLYYFDITIEVPRVKQGQSFIVELFHHWQRKVIG